MKTTRLFKDFFNSEKAGGLVLISCTILSLVLANSRFGDAYQHFWHTPFAGGSIEYWVNDGLMAIFFLLIGLELEREIYQGELSNIKDALFPILGAIGGMLVPAGIYLFLNHDTPTQSGAGIPMATDIAFALGILSLLGNKVPTSLKVFLTALAVIDDLGAIIVIALFYTNELAWANLGLALGIFGLLLALNRLKVHNLIPYLVGGILMWYFMLHSGVHATISGVLLAFAIPFGDGKPASTSYILQHYLHKPIAFFVLPLFALANTAIAIDGNFSHALSENYSLGVALGLLVGKPLGIFAFTFLATQSGICRLPSDLAWKDILAVGMLAGIGFTMSIFIALLAFENQTIINHTKLVILLSSSVAAIAGFIVLSLRLQSRESHHIPDTSDTDSSY